MQLRGLTDPNSYRQEFYQVVQLQSVDRDHDATSPHPISGRGSFPSASAMART
jgi:hypothetical protein